MQNEENKRRCQPVDGVQLFDISIHMFIYSVFSPATEKLSQCLSNQHIIQSRIPSSFPTSFPKKSAFFPTHLNLNLNFFIPLPEYMNKGWPARWHLLYYILLNMFQTLIRPSSGISEYLLCCVGWLEACWCYVAMQWSHKQTKVEVWLSHTERITIIYTRIPHHQQTIPLHNTNTPQVSLHNTTCTR